jgi:hypothetical protein
MACCGKKAAERRKVIQDLLDDYEQHARGIQVMRESCKTCACKHISQARALLLEMNKGYPEHYWFAMGHLAEAEDELMKEHPELGTKVREERLKLEQDKKYWINFADLINAIDPPESK